MRNTAPKDAAEIEALETREWLESLDYVIKSGGPVRVSKLLRELSDHARRNGVKLPFTANTPYVNTISTDAQPPFPGSREIERRIKSLVRWNALAMVVKANKVEDCVGRNAVRGRLQSLLQGQGRRQRRRHHLLPGARGARNLRARVPRRAPLGAEARELPPRAEGRRRPLVVPAPVADARFLGVPHGQHGPRPDLRHLPGPLHALPRRSRAEEALELEGVGLPRRRRDRR